VPSDLRPETCRRLKSPISCERPIVRGSEIHSTDGSIVDQVKSPVELYHKRLRSLAADLVYWRREVGWAVTLKRRLIVAGLLTCFALAVLAAAKHYSVPLIAYVVEEALVQKLPAGTDPPVVRQKFQALIAALPDRQLKLEKLLYMSQYLEKLQTIDRQELEWLLTQNPAGLPAGRP
jgi:hypothetical protein